MKKLLLLFVATASLLVSCSSDDNSSDNATSSLIGKWEAQSFDFSVTLGGQPIELEEDEEFEVTGVVGTIFEFKANNEVAVTSYEEIDENQGEWVTDHGTYVYNEAAKTITITTIDDFDGSPEVVVMKVDLLTKSKFNFTINDKFEFEDEETGIEIEADLSLNIKCERKN